MTDSDKPAALLTNTQRDYLTGKSSVSDSYERNLRDDIHDRIEATIGDFATLFHELDQDDVREAFGENFATRIGIDDQKLEQAVEGAGSADAIDVESVEEEPPTPRSTAALSPAVIAFLLRGLNYEDEQIYEYLENIGKPQPALSQFTEILEQGIEMYLKSEQGYLANVEVEIKLNNLTPTDEILQNK